MCCRRAAPRYREIDALFNLLDTKRTGALALGGLREAVEKLQGAAAEAERSVAEQQKVAEQLKEAADASQAALSAMFEAEKAAAVEEQKLVKLKQETALGTKLGELFAKSGKGHSTKAADILRSWDSDGDGVISRKEFHRSVRALGLEANEEEMNGLFDALDDDRSGQLELDEIRSAIPRLQQSAKALAQEAEKIHKKAGRHRRASAASLEGISLIVGNVLTPEAQPEGSAAPNDASGEQAAQDAGDAVGEGAQDGVAAAAKDGAAAGAKPGGSGSKATKGSRAGKAGKGGAAAKAANRKTAANAAAANAAASGAAASGAAASLAEGSSAVDGGAPASELAAVELAAAEGSVDGDGAAALAPAEQAFDATTTDPEAVGIASGAAVVAAARPACGDPSVWGWAGVGRVGLPLAAG